MPAHPLSPPPRPTTERKKPAQDVTGKDGAKFDARDISSAHSTGVASWDGAASREESRKALKLYQRAATQAKFAAATDLSRYPGRRSFQASRRLWSERSWPCALLGFDAGVRRTCTT